MNFFQSDSASSFTLSRFGHPVPLDSELPKLSRQRRVVGVIDVQAARANRAKSEGDHSVALYLTHVSLSARKDFLKSACHFGLLRRA
ncbi:hypothetical protein CEXT_63761 [Caerostris extrusa]|uniref:Uncharacterized protein n=1 Tax=Caerostris extrusa TaxID=172846 RepID=A0AAV4QBA8_CAEEX|nr:hypothetical protein CEXT_63761 [Caerostris extrusa]